VETLISCFTDIIWIPARILGLQIVLQVWWDALREALRSSCDLTHVMLISLSQFFEVRMLQELRCCVSVISVVNDHLHDYILSFLRDMRNKLGDTNELLRCEVQLHVSSMSIGIMNNYRTFGNCQASLKEEYPWCCESCWFSQVHFRLGRVGTKIRFQRKHSQLPRYPFYTHSNRRLEDIQELYTI